MTRLFGTDGVRGLANKDITADLAIDLGVAAGSLVVAKRLEETGAIPVISPLMLAGGVKAGPLPVGETKFRRPRVIPGEPAKPRAIVGRDTRVSGEFLDHAVAAGLASAGMDVTRVGVIPTPGIAYLTAAQDFELGVVISASHNPMQDNGIKFFARGGYKLADSLEDRIEEMLGQEGLRPIGPGVGTVRSNGDAADRAYVDHLVSSIPDTLHGLRIAVDCANGAASQLGPQTLQEAGADVVVINASPDGRNINDACGSTHPEQLQAVTVASKADFGVAFDGDADRCLAVDAAGNMVDGDQIMGLLALDMQSSGRLAYNTLVITVMSNLGLRLAMEERGISLVTTGVGDRYVLEAMREGGYTLGGEQSGHLINSLHATTGDGILTALQIASSVRKTGDSLAKLAGVVQRLPQILINVAGVDRTRTNSDTVLADAVAQAEARLGSTGRVLLRPSGTEPLVRVMVEAATQEQADDEAGRIAQVVRDRLAL
ncbi:MAG: phosphoglucosamine mutase [Actinomycetaceae bacterium]|nr:phosphoglucosamine mutase [Actinomycetaceae bacterium]